MNKVIEKLRKLTNSESDSIIELIEAYSRKYPNSANVAMLLKDYAYSEGNEKITENQMLKILSRQH